MSNTSKCKGKTENAQREGAGRYYFRLKIEVSQGKCNRMGQVLRTLPKERFMRCLEVEKNGNKDKVKFRKRKQ